MGRHGLDAARGRQQWCCDRAVPPPAVQAAGRAAPVVVCQSGESCYSAFLIARRWNMLARSRCNLVVPKTTPLLPMLSRMSGLLQVDVNDGKRMMMKRLRGAMGISSRRSEKG